MVFCYGGAYPIGLSYQVEKMIILDQNAKVFKVDADKISITPNDSAKQRGIKMKKERIVKLPIGQANILIKKCRPAKAKGCKMLKGWKAMPSPKQVEAFNTPTLIIRKAA